MSQYTQISNHYAISETNRRREIQQKFNEENGIIPKTIRKDVHEVIEATKAVTVPADKKRDERKNRERTIAELNTEMRKAAELLQFELAAQIRDEIRRLEAQENE